MNQVVPLGEISKANPKYDYSYMMNRRMSLCDLIISKTLTGKGRGIIIRQIKWPIERTIIRSIKLFIKVFGRVTKENSRLHNTHVLLDLREEFFQHYTNPSKMELMNSAWELLVFENEHDVHYEWLFNWLVTRVAEEKAKGNYVEMPVGFPQEGCWKE